MFEYEKTVLYLYPKIGYLKKMYHRLADAMIRSSSADSRTLQYINEIIDYTFLVGALEELRQTLECILAGLSEDEKCLIEYKYFRRKRLLYGKYENYEFPFSYSSFFRKIRNVTRKISVRLHAAGYDEKVFLTEFSSSDIVMRVYCNVTERKDECFLRGKECSFRFLPKDSAFISRRNSIVSSARASK